MHPKLFDVPALLDSMEISPIKRNVSKIIESLVNYLVYDDKGYLVSAHMRLQDIVKDNADS